MKVSSSCFWPWEECRLWLNGRQRHPLFPLSMRVLIAKTCVINPLMRCKSTLKYNHMSLFNSQASLSPSTSHFSSPSRISNKDRRVHKLQLFCRRSLEVILFDNLPSFFFTFYVIFWLTFTLSWSMSNFSFLDAPSHLYKRSCPSVRPSVRPSRVIFTHVLGASCAVYPALFLSVEPEEELLWLCRSCLLSMEFQPDAEAVEIACKGSVLWQNWLLFHSKYRWMDFSFYRKD